jgi:Flp pilus assembly protein TadB
MIPVLLSTGVVGALGILLPRLVRRRRRDREEAALRAALAPTVDLIAVVVGSGGTVADAVRLVAADGPGAARRGFTSVVVRQRNGAVLSDALQSISAELGTTFHPLATMLIGAELGGAPVGLLLERLVEEALEARRRAMTDALGRLPVALLVPLVVCQLPALVLGSVIPLTVVAIRQLGL